MRAPLSIMLVASIVAATPVGGQQWQHATDIALVERAINQREQRDGDTLVASWAAKAHGIVRFASVIDHGGSPVERIIKLDELRVEVYGEAPNRSKQVIVAWRDTSFLPNRVAYHRDHLGIVAHDFGGVIRLGEGEEVRDVAHPLSASGRERYLFAVGDTTMISTGRNRIRVVAVQVRPVEAAEAGTVGTLYLDADRGVLVRFRFTFSPSSYRDDTVEDITVSLENALLDGQRWLPWRQAIIIRRGSKHLDFPVRTLLRGDWTIDDYTLGVAHPQSRFSGPFIAGLRRPQPDSTWPHPLIDEIEALPATDSDVEAARREALNSIQQSLGGLPRTRLQFGGISGALAVNRVQGVTAGGGTQVPLGARTTLKARIGFGLSDRRAVGHATMSHAAAGARWSLTAERLVRDVGDEPIISTALNSLRTALTGDDRLDWVLLDRIMAGVAGETGGWNVMLEAGMERSSSIRQRFTPLQGVAAPNAAFGVGDAFVGRVSAQSLGPLGNGVRASAEIGTNGESWARVTAVARQRFAAGSGIVHATLQGGIGTAELPSYRSFVIGGRATLAGIDHRSLGGRRVARAELAWMLPASLSSPPVPQSRHFRLPSAVGPFVAAGVAGGGVAGVPWQATRRVEPVAGLRLDLWGPLLRVEAGVSLRTGNTAIYIDAHPDWWPLL